MERKDAFTILRIIFSPIVMALIFSNKMIAAFFLYTAAAITDILDGYFARKSKKVSKEGEVFDALADFTLIYLTVFALAVKREGLLFTVLIVTSLVILVCIIGAISMKKGYFTIPHLVSSKVLAGVVHLTIMAYIIGWQHAGKLLLIVFAVGTYTAMDYSIYALKQKSL